MKFSRVLSLLALCLCWEPVWALRGLEVTPATVPAAAEAEVSIKLEGLAAGSQLALVPAGPYVSHHIPLAAEVTTMSNDGQYLFVALQADGGGHEIQVFAFAAEAEARAVARIAIPQGRVSTLRFRHGHLLAVVEGFGVLLLDVTVPKQPRQLSQYAQKRSVRDAQLTGDGEAYLLLGERRLEKVNLQGEKGRRLAAWILPMPAHALAVKGDMAIVSGREGVATVSLQSSRPRLLDLYATSSVPRDIHFADDLVLVDGNAAGLVVFRLGADGRLLWLGSHNKRGSIRGLTLNGGRVWVNLDGRSLLQMGLKNPQLPSTGLVYRAAAAVSAVTAASDALFVATAGRIERVVFPVHGGEQLSPEGVNLGGSRRGVIRDNILYVADWFSGLHLYDISDPKQLKHLGNYHTPGSSKGVLLAGNFALVGDDDQGLQVVDVSDPQRPRWVSELAPSAMDDLGLAYTMKLVDKLLYLADHRGGFHIIDVSDMRQPRRVGGFDTPSKSWAIDVVDKVAFVADDSSGLLSFDVSDPSAPQPLGQFSPGGQAEDVVVRDGLAYVAFFDAGFYVVDIRDPQHPKAVGHVPVPGNARGIQLVGDLAYVTGWESGLQAIDISRPETPRIVGHFDTRGSAWGVNVQGDYAYVLDWWGGIQVLDVAEPSRPRLVSRYHAREPLQMVRTRGNYLYAANGRAGLQVFDIKNGFNPIWAVGVDLPGEARDVWLDDDHAYVALGVAGVAVVDVLDPFYSRAVGHLDLPAEAMAVRAWNGYLYVAQGEAGLTLVDVREPSRPKLVETYPQAVHDLWISEGRLFAVNAAGLQVFTLAGDGRLHREAEYAVPNASLIRARDDLVALLDGDSQVQLLRLTDGGLSHRGSFVPGDKVLDLQLTADGLYVVAEQLGLMVLDLQDVAQPRLSAVYPATGRHTNLALAHGSAFLAGGLRLASTVLLPPVTWQGPKVDEVVLRLPEDFPSGAYHLLSLSPQGERRWYPLVLERRAPGLGKGGNGLEAIRRLLKGPLKPPAEP